MPTLEALGFSPRKRTAYLLWTYLTFIVLMGAVGYYNGRNDFFLKNLPSSLVGKYFYDMDRMTINIGAPFTAAQGAARMAISLEVNEKDSKLVQSYAPRIMDRIQGYMNSLTPDDLRSMPSLQWLRRDLLWEANKVSGPVRILNVNFRQFVLV